LFFTFSLAGVALGVIFFGIPVLVLVLVLVFVLLIRLFHAHLLTE
jgi:hypothetical protein